MNVTFIYSNVNFGRLKSFEFSKELKLRHATKSELESVKNHLVQLDTIYPIGWHIYLKRTVDKNGRGTFFTKDRPTWVIEDIGEGNRNSNLFEDIASLCKHKLFLGVTFFDDQGKMFHTKNERRILEEEQKKPERTINKSELEKLKRYYSIYPFEEEMNSADYALNLYNDASLLSPCSPLLTLSLFSIIESLIAHKPKQAESLDSINSQIKNKLNLLTKMFDNPISKDEYFDKNMALDKIIGKLYGLRSCIAHGNRFAFDRGEYQCLKSVQNVNLFLDEVTRELIKLSIDKYEFIEDLKQC